MSDKKPEEFEEEVTNTAEDMEVLEEEATTDAEESSTDESVDSDSGELLKRLNEAEESARENQEKYLRTVADLENFRRRSAREREELREHVIGSLVEDLLPAMDNLRLGLQAADNHPEAKDVAYGFRMVADQLKKTLKTYGLEEEIPTGKTFDPNSHDCMSHEAHEEVAEGEVIQTIRPGYRMKKRLLRAASVVVSSGPPSEETES
jgi:molecular chaperone GrpE